MPPSIPSAWTKVRKPYTKRSLFPESQTAVGKVKRGMSRAVAPATIVVFRK
jgi:hypothetical protein